MKTAFIYALCEPGTRTVRYIGKANNVARRFQNHLATSAKHKNHLGAWLRMLKSRGEIPNLVVLREVPFEMWQEEEIRYIHAAKVLGMDLTNAVAGGGGCLSPSPETRAKMRGRIVSEENKAKMRGRTVSEETRAKMRAAHFGIPFSEERKAKTRGRIVSEETRAKMRAAHFGKTHTEEAKSKMRGRKFSEEHRQNLSAAATARYQKI